MKNEGLASAGFTLSRDCCTSPGPDVKPENSGQSE